MNSKLTIIIVSFSILLGLFLGVNEKIYMTDKLKVSGDNLSLNSQSGSTSELGNTSSGDEYHDVSGEQDIEETTLSGDKDIDVDSTVEYVPHTVAAVYSTGWVMGTPSLRQSMIKSIKENSFNAVVLDIKDEAGQLSYNSKVQTAIDIKASRGMIRNIEDVIKELKENDIYVIGRIVTFKDPIYASKVADISYKKSDGTVWKDYRGNAWPNPYNEASWEYPIALAKEAAELGFQEIQFDYIRFPSSEGKISLIDYGVDIKSNTKSQAINSFLQKAMQELEPYNVAVSADVFSITTKRDGDFENIGQDFAKIASIVDVICPMIYPSHYNFNEYGLSRPDKNPYSIIKYALEDAFERYESYTSGDLTVKMATIRPYYQDFTASWLGSGNYLSYGVNEVKAQIQAGYDLGIQDFCLWDPNNKYCYSALAEVVITENSTVHNTVAVTSQNNIY